MGAVDDVKNDSGHDSQEEDDEDGDGSPETAGPAASSAVATAGGLGAVVSGGSAVELGLGGRKGWRAAVSGGFRRRGHFGIHC